MTSKRTITTFIITCGVVALSLTAYGALVVVLGNAQSKLAEGQRVYATYQAESGEYTALSRQSALLADTRAELGSYIIPQDGVVDFLILVESLGQNTGTVVAATNITVMEGKDGMDTVTLKLEAEGSYTGVRTVLELLETLPYPTQIMSTELRRTSVEEAVVWEGVYTITVLKEHGV